MKHPDEPDTAKPVTEEVSPPPTARFEATTAVPGYPDKLAAIKHSDGSVSIWVDIGSSDKAVVLSAHDAMRLDVWLRYR